MLKKLLQRLRGARPAPPPPPLRDVPHIPSPVPWISDEIWSGIVSYGPQEGPLPVLREPRLYVVTRDDQRRAPVLSIAEGAKVPKWSTYYENKSHLERLKSPAGCIHLPTWPMCCGRLATLINERGDGRSLESIEAEAGAPLDLAFMEMEIWHDWTPESQESIDEIFRTGYGEMLAELRKEGMTDSVLIFQCRACGRVYVGSCSP